MEKEGPGATKYKSSPQLSGKARPPAGILQSNLTLATLTCLHKNCRKITKGKFFCGTFHKLKLHG